MDNPYSTNNNCPNGRITNKIHRQMNKAKRRAREKDRMNAMNANEVIKGYHVNESILSLFLIERYRLDTSLFCTRIIFVESVQEKALKGPILFY